MFKKKLREMLQSARHPGPPAEKVWTQKKEVFAWMSRGSLSLTLLATDGAIHEARGHTGELLVRRRGGLRQDVDRLNGLSTLEQKVDIYLVVEPTH